MQRFVSKAMLGKGMGISVTKKLKPAKKQSFLTVIRHREAMLDQR